jgi:hypothetical protein
MDLQPKRNGSGEPEALEPIELPVFEKGHHLPHPFLA